MVPPPPPDMFRSTHLYILAIYSESSRTCHWALFVPDFSSGTLSTTGTLFNCAYDPTTHRWTYRRTRGFNPSDKPRVLVVLVAQLADVSYLGKPANICEAIHQCCANTKIPVQASASNGDTPGTLWMYDAIRALDSSCVVNCPSATQLQNEINTKMIQAFPNFQRNLTHSCITTTRCTSS